VTASGRGGAGRDRVTQASPNSPLAIRERIWPERERVSPELRRCARCRRDLPRSYFGFDRSMKDGLRSWCRACFAERNREWRADNPGYVAEANAARRLGPFQKICSRCGEEFSAKRRGSKRCPDCQTAHRREQKR
jgi:hypothetical protein